MEFSADWVKRYFTHKLSCPNLEIIDLTRFPRGSSRDTWFVEIREDSQAAPRKLVVRCDWSTGAIDSCPLKDEYEIYERLGRTEVPAARALFWEDDPAWIGTGLPFYIRSHIEGSWDVPHFLDPDPVHDDLRIAVSKEHLRKLAIVHTVDWRAAGFADLFPTPVDEADCAHQFVDWVIDRIDEDRIGAGGEGYPILIEAVEWLHDNAPVAPCVCLCKGTNGLGEEVFRDGKIVALSDWEEAHIGDPAADFAFMQNFIPEIRRGGEILWDLERALEFYRSVSGIPVEASSVHYYTVVRFLRLAMTGIHAANSVQHDPSPTVRKAWVAFEVLNLAKRGLAGSIGLIPAVSGTRFAELNQTI